MNKAGNGNSRNGRLLGHVNYDAGLVRYRQLLSQSHPEGVKAEKKAGRAVRERRARKVAPIAAALLLVLSIAAAGNVCHERCLLSPGYGGGGSAVASIVPMEQAVFAECGFGSKLMAWGGAASGGSAIQVGKYWQFSP